MRHKREKMIRDYLYEEKEKKTLTAKDIVRGIDFSTPQTKPKTVKKKFNSRMFSTCMSYVLVVLLTIISFCDIVEIIKTNDSAAEEEHNDQYDAYSTFYFDKKKVNIMYETNENGKVFYVSIRLSNKYDKFTIAFKDKAITIDPNKITYIATLEENEELEFDILYNGERRHCIINNYN